jgi:endoglucanase
MMRQRIPLNALLKAVSIALLLFMYSSGRSEESNQKEENLLLKIEVDREEKFYSLKNLSAVERHGQLRIEGNKIIDAKGKEVQLRGMSLFWSQWMGKFYTKEAVKWLRDDWGCTAIRAAMAVEAGGYLANPEVEKQKIFAVIDAAIENGLYVIVDWHDHHGEKHLKEAKKFFGEVAKKYGNRPNIIYETYNEPLAVDWVKVLKPYHKAIIDTIRYHDSDNIIVCGTPNWSQDVDVAASSPLTGSNIAYTLHFYAGTHKAELRSKAESALKRGIALMITEWGTTTADGDGNVHKKETSLWWRFADDNKLSWFNWSVADKREGSAALKPGASGKGGWKDNEITESGKFVREELRAKKIAP